MASEKITLMLQFLDEATPFAYQVHEETYNTFSYLEGGQLQGSDKAYWIDQMKAHMVKLRKELEEGDRMELAQKTAKGLFQNI